MTLVFPWGHVKAPMADFEREWVALDEWLAPRAGHTRVRIDRIEDAERTA